MSSARDLADRFHERWLRVNPFSATMYGIPGYDHLLPPSQCPRLPQRPGPHGCLPGRAHLPVRPVPALPPPPPRQASPRLAARTTRTRHHALDHTLRPQPHHPAHHLRNLTTGAW